MGFIKKYQWELGLVLVFIAVNVADYFTSYVTVRGIMMVGVSLLAIYFSIIKKFK